MKPLGERRGKITGRPVSLSALNGIEMESGMVKKGESKWRKVLSQLPVGGEMRTLLSEDLGAGNVAEASTD